VRTGTRTLARAEAGADAVLPGGAPAPDGDPVAVQPPVTGAAGTGQPLLPPPGADGTLLAVVPIPGTGTSLAIVGYPVSAPGNALGVPLPGGLAVVAGQFPGGQFPGGPFPVADLSADHPVAGQPAAERPGLLLDHDRRRLWVDGDEVPLTFQEFELLAFLSAHPATVFSRADLVKKVWQRDFAADSRTVDVHVSRLRHKLGPAYGKCLVTEYRVGYQFRAAT
jgi:Transcriptional regulatory protein, C terminal